jgi:hypothetical protein
LIKKPTQDSEVQDKQDSLPNAVANVIPKGQKKDDKDWDLQNAQWLQKQCKKRKWHTRITVGAE